MLKSFRPTIGSPPSTLIWVAWISAPGVVVATGRYDHKRSRQIDMHASFIEWFLPISTTRAGGGQILITQGEWTAGHGQPYARHILRHVPL